MALAFVLVPRLAAGESTAKRATDPVAPAAAACADSSRRYRADVDDAWRAIRDRYVYLRDKPVDWSRVRARVARTADTVHSRRALVGVLEDLLDPLYDAHATLGTNTAHSPRLVPTGIDLWAEWRTGGAPARTAEAVVTAVRPGYSADQAGVRPGWRVLAINGVPVDAAADARLNPGVPRPAPPAARAWALLSALAGRHDTPRVLRVRDAAGRVREVPLDHRGQHVVDAPTDEPPVEFSWLADSADGTRRAYGYIRLNGLSDVRGVAAFDSALTALRDTHGLVLDLRNIPSGGNTDVAEPILGRLITTVQGYQRVVPRGGPTYVRVVRPRGPWTYTAPVVALVGRWTGSMGEGMAIALDGMQVHGRPRATVVGTRMAGLAGSVDDTTLPCSGIRLTFATARLLHVGGTPRERWLPPVTVDLTTLAAAAMPDPVLARGLDALRR